MPDPLIAEMDALATAELPRLIEIRHDLHAHPQRGFQETYAAAVIQRLLKEAGIPFQSGVGKTGVVGWLAPRAAEGQPAVALRADMDALPIAEQTHLPYASQNAGCMHACGHDGHVAILLGAARVLAAMRDRLPQPVKFIFQPAEEGLGGARQVIADGALEERIGGLKVGAIYALHGWPALPVGAIGTRPGALMARADVFDILLRGTGGHGAMPHKAADPVLAAAHVVTAVQSIVARNVEPTDAAVVTVGQFHAGTAFNIIPAQAELGGTVRSLDDATGELIHRRLRELACGVAEAFGCTAEVRIRTEYPPTVNDPAATEHVLRVGRAVLGEGHVLIEEKPKMGSEDFSFYCRSVPGCYFLLGLKAADSSGQPAVHSPQFDFNDQAIPTGVKVLAGLALLG